MSGRPSPPTLKVPGLAGSCTWQFPLSKGFNGDDLEHTPPPPGGGLAGPAARAELSTPADYTPFYYTPWAEPLGRLKDKEASLGLLSFFCSLP